MLAGFFVVMISLSAGIADTKERAALLPSAQALVVGPVDFEEIYFLAGQNQERRWPRVGEEFIVKAKIRNLGSAATWYLPSLCDSSLSAVFDPSYVRVESGRPRCLAASMPTQLSPGEEATVWAPESGTVYEAVRAGSTTATAVFAYNTDSSMKSSTRAEARSTVPLTIEGGFGGLPIPGFPIESLIVGLALAVGILLLQRRIKKRSGGGRAGEQELFCDSLA
jgi:hypothetical protein